MKTWLKLDLDLITHTTSFNHFVDYINKIPKLQNLNLS